ncbi:MAG TPA: hypothetical protein VIW26_12015 [Gemmatimonadales bacterium]|jgi:hypothetical protein
MSAITTGPELTRSEVIREAQTRVGAASNVLDAIRTGHWPADPDIIDQIATLLIEASVWTRRILTA